MLERVAALRVQPSPAGGSPDCPDHRSGVPCPTTPADRERCSCRVLPCRTRPPAFLNRVGSRNFTFEACSGFTYATACRIAQLPEAAFVASFSPPDYPAKPLATLPDQTDYYLKPSSTGDRRRRGALRHRAKFVTCEQPSVAKDHRIQATVTIELRGLRDGGKSPKPEGQRR